MKFCMCCRIEIPSHSISGTYCQCHNCGILPGLKLVCFLLQVKTVQCRTVLLASNCERVMKNFGYWECNTSKEKCLNLSTWGSLKKVGFKLVAAKVHVCKRCLLEYIGCYHLKLAKFTVEYCKICKGLFTN